MLYSLQCAELVLAVDAPLQESFPRVEKLKETWTGLERGWGDRRNAETHVAETVFKHLLWFHVQIRIDHHFREWGNRDYCGCAIVVWLKTGTTNTTYECVVSADTAVRSCRPTVGAGVSSEACHTKRATSKLLHAQTGFSRGEILPWGFLSPPCL